MTHRIIIEYEVTTSFKVLVYRDELPASHDQLLKTVTYDEVDGCFPWPEHTPTIHEDHIKEAWRSATPESTWVFDEYKNPLFYPLPT
jgi:hypothetical protein